jgi:hypothetical protein
VARSHARNEAGYRGLNSFHCPILRRRAGRLLARRSLGGSASPAYCSGQDDREGFVMDGIPNSPCFVRGTHIRTPQGEVLVENLTIGQPVSTVSGASQPVKWVGRRAYAAHFVGARAANCPVRIRQGALGDGLPHRDLYVSENHALYLEGALIEAGLVVNGRSIEHLRAWSEPIEYFHVELERHDVIFAEGAPAETYLDCRNRFTFQNAESFRTLYPDFRISDQVEWGPRLVSGPALDAVRARLSRCADSLTPETGLAS